MPRVLEISTTHISPFKTLFEVLKEILREANITFLNKKEDKNGVMQDGGIKISTIDTSQTILIYMKLNAGSFEKYFCARDGFFIGVNLELFYKHIKTTEKEDILTLYMDEEDINTLKIEISNSTSGLTKKSEIGLMDTDGKSVNMNSLNFPVSITMLSTAFVKVCKEMQTLGESMEIICVPNSGKIDFTTKSEGTKSTQTFVEKSENSKIKIRINEKNKVKDNEVIQGMFELKNLMTFQKCASLCQHIELFLANDLPLTVVYNVAAFGRVIICVSPIRNDIIEIKEHN